MRSTFRQLTSITKISGILAGAVLALSVSAAPVAAAGSTTQSDLTGCFSWTTGAAYAGYTVYLDRWNATTQSWDAKRTGTSNKSGCVRFDDLPVGYYFRLHAFTTVGKTCQPYGGIYRFDGFSGWVGPTLANDALWNVGRNYVYTTAQC